MVINTHSFILDIEILSNLRFDFLEIRDTSVTRVVNKYPFRNVEAVTHQQRYTFYFLSLTHNLSFK